MTDIIQMQENNQQSNRLGDILLKKKLINERVVNNILDVVSERGIKFGEAAVMLNLVNQEDIDYALAQQYEFPYLRTNNTGLSDELIAAFKPYSKDVESLRELRSRLKLRWFSNEHKSLAIISPDDNNKKTLVAANLSIVFSQLGERTLLIDTDMRNPRLGDLFKISNSNGLSAVLNGRCQIKEALIKIPEFNHLTCLTAGVRPPNPQELLTRKSFGMLINMLKQNYDVIIVDTPPTNKNTDAQIVASECGGALLVAKQNYSKYSDVKSIIEQLTDINVNIVGSVMGKV